MVSSVSFGGAHVHNAGTSKKNHKAGKVILGTIATAAAVTAGLAVGAKKGVFLDGIAKLIKSTAKSSPRAQKIATVFGGILEKADIAGNAILKFGNNIFSTVTESGAYKTVAKFVKDIPQKTNKVIDKIKIAKK